MVVGRQSFADKDVRKGFPTYGSLGRTPDRKMLEHWRYSSARNYAGQEGLIEVVRAW
ncbi:hypothetical protein [Methylocaldum gracile]|jgi:hypothetical protein|uniref:hypothetical protein n=1 Tax=unclassified Methylocaldum TaxID=2622260 RepID=UPI001B4CA0C8